MYSKIYILLALCFCLTSCEEKMVVIPEINPPPGDRKVLIEEFTGVKCTNCPQGSAEIENLIALFGDKLVPISIHAGFFSTPLPNNDYDFRTATGDDLLNYLTEPGGYPAAVINRTKVNTKIHLGQSQWASAIEAEFAKDPIVGIDISLSTESGSVGAKISVVGLEDIAEPIYLTVLAVENNVKDAQLTPSGIIEDYSHKHVLRGALSASTGDKIAESINTGESLSQSFSFDPSSILNMDNLGIIAFVHYNKGDQKQVLQVEEAHL